MELSTILKMLAVGAGLGIAYHLYRVYQTGEAVTYSVKDVDLRRQGSTLYVDVAFTIMNPTSYPVTIKGIGGSLKLLGNIISTFAGPGATIKPGLTDYKTTFKIDNLGAVSAIVASITQKKWPVFDVTMKTILPLFPVSETFQIDTKSYANKFLSSLGLA